MAIKIQNNTVIYDDRVFNIGSGTTSQRPSAPEQGMLRYNTDESGYEIYNSSQWSRLGAVIPENLFQYSLEPLGAGWLPFDGSIALQSSYPDVYANTGLIVDNPRLAGTWLTASSAGDGSIGALEYLNGIYLIGSIKGMLQTSTDGITWTVRTSNTTSQITAFAYGNGLYLAGGRQNSLQITSTDAVTWTARTLSFSTTALAYGNGIFVSVAGFGLRTSTDAVTWTARTSGVTTEIQSIAYGNGMFVYVAKGGLQGTSTDGTTWTTTNSGRFLDKVIFGGGTFNKFIAKFAEAASISTSTNGVTWSSANVTYTSNLKVYSIAHNNNVMVVELGGLYSPYGAVTYTSTNGTTFSLLRTHDTVAYQQMVYGFDRLIGASYAGGYQYEVGIAYSYDPAIEFKLPTINYTDTAGIVFHQGYLKV